MLGKAWRKRLAAVLIFMCMGLTACGVRTLPLWKIVQGMVECYDGEGTYEYANGDRYEGEWKEGKQEGTGTYYFANGERYEGEWKAGQLDGTGTLYYADGSYYQGEWKDGMIYNGM